MIAINVLLSGVLFCCLYVETFQKPLQIHPPVWEYTYQYELFEKTYGLALTLQSELARLRNNLELTKCPIHWITGDDTCYRLSQHRKLDWYESQEACERAGGHLAVLDSVEEGELVSVLLQTYSKEERTSLKETWIGGYWSEEYWRWVTGKRLSNLTNGLNDGMFPDIALSSSTRPGYCLSLHEDIKEVECKTKIHYLCERKPVSIT